MSEALKRMHMLAADPGIISVMNKHRWRVGIMTEMAPIGYVGISPKCILGFNKNHGEEISLRLRTDDLKGFRKYESIKKTLLHELAHMVYSEHDANFYALDKQLNQEAESLDWTRSRSHTLSGVQYSEHYEENFYVGGRSNSSQKLGGNMSDRLPSARTSSVAAAYQRLATASHDSVSEVHEESHPDDSIPHMRIESSHMDFVGKGNLEIRSSHKIQWKPDMEPDPDDQSGNQNNFEPSPDESSSQSLGSGTLFGQDFSESMMSQPVSHSVSNRKLEGTESREEPDADYMEACLKHDVVAEPEPFHSHEIEILESRIQPRNNVDEPDPDDLDAKPDDLGCGSYGNIIRPNHDDSLVSETIKYEAHPRKVHNEPDPDDSQSNGVILAEPDPDDSQSIGIIQAEPDPDDSQSIGIIQAEPDPDDSQSIGIIQAEPDPDDSQSIGIIQAEPDPDDSQSIGIIQAEPDPDDSQSIGIIQAEPDPDDSQSIGIIQAEPDPDDSQSIGIIQAEPDPDDSQSIGIIQAEPDPDDSQSIGIIQAEPDPDDSQSIGIIQAEPDPDDSQSIGIIQAEPDPDDSQSIGIIQAEPDPDDSQSIGIIQAEPDPDDSQPLGIIPTEPDPDDNLVHPREISRMQIDEPDPDDEEFQRIQDPVTIFCKRLQENIELLQAEVNPTQATTVLQTLFKIIRNVLEHPGEIKYRRLRKANPAIQRNVANYKAAMAILFLLGFNENVVDEIGRPETYLVLKRDDPGLLWLAKSSLETCITF
ncbi:uncharacterized protein LOC110745351 [Prunus avium]|uniref:Uncharacterized protein LOC110745351 n=1 Tax=Prunus avium TaxID=42229 RepID=A0A6P5RGW2_PRUAV|nr:uncharacterized protein LOC110745351 [Prunus avium]